ncbi:nucleoside hydrolase [Pseudonocardia nantongensis]|uniref:nucleoside hydrolase n=1 Tax=Pseudonocardia nantongensis TaxID=1181885 RepID=UPI00397A77BD
MPTDRAEMVVLDTDPGIGPRLDADDPLALLLILASPELELRGVTTVFGNVTVERSTESALRVLEAVGRLDVPVARGMSVALNGRLHDESVAEYAAQEQRIGPVDGDRVEHGRVAEHGVDFLVRTVLENPHQVRIIAVGPLTNVATAILKEPTFVSKTKAITIMGGAFGFDTGFGRGNITPSAEYNIWHDPDAARIVFESGIPMTVCGLDVTNPSKGTVLTEDQLLELVNKETAFAEFLHQMCKTYIDEPRFAWTTGQNSCILYDPVAVGSVIDPSLVRTRRTKVRVETRGEYTNGQTIADLRSDEGGHVDVAVDVDGPRFVELFVKRLTELRDATA